MTDQNIEQHRKAMNKPAAVNLYYIVLAVFICSNAVCEAFSWLVSTMQVSSSHASPIE